MQVSLVKDKMEHWELMQVSFVIGTVLRDFYHFFGLKDSTWAPYEQAKNSYTNFFVFAKIFAINMRPHSQRRLQKM